MHLKRSLTLFALLTVLVSGVIFPGSTMAQTDSADEAEICRQLDQAGALDILGYVTLGDCVNHLSGLESGNVHRLIVAACGMPYIHAFLGTTNRGECVQYFTVQPSS